MKLLATFSNCPRCLEDNRVMDSIVREEIANGNMNADATPCTQINLFSNVDMLRPPIPGGRLPAARIYKDICVHCGQEFVTRIETGHVTIPLTVGTPPVFT